MATERPRAATSLMRAVCRRLVIGLVAFAAIVAAVLLGSDALLDWDRLAIEGERSRRQAQFAIGQTLAGTPDLTNLPGRLAAQQLSIGAPVFIRIFKREFELELWMKRGDQFHRFATYPICRWSGGLGPKLKEGDAQAPEGFYTVDAKALNPASQWHRSFNLGFPNAFDRAHGRTGSFLMVHGGCSSIGCYAMTDPVVDEIWRLITAALKAGQKRFAVHVFPFRMTAQNLERRRHLAWSPFWEDFKHGHDLFETTLVPPRVNLCQGRYAFAAAPAGGDGSHEIANGCMDEGSRS